MEYAVLRDDMVDGLEHEAKAVVRSDRVSVAMRAVPRHEFVPDPEFAYSHRSFQVHGTTVLSPSTAALLLEALDAHPGECVLVVGVGAGYTAAALAEIVGATNVHAVDITRPLVWEARENLARAGYGDVLVDCRDGAAGLPAYAPFDRILVEAASVKPPAMLVDQLAPDGRLVLPLGASAQRLVAVEHGRVVDDFGSVAFRPMLVDGEQVGTVERNRTAREDQEFAARAQERRAGWEQQWIDWD